MTSAAQAHGSWPRQPFRPFFLMAGLDAVAGIWPWLPGGGVMLPAGASAAAWHRDELLFGVMPAVLAGFILTALPRWTGRPTLSPPALAGLAALWLAARFSHAWLGDRAAVLSGVFILVLAVIVAEQVMAAGKTRDIKVVLLLFLLAAAAMLPEAAPGAPAFGFRLRLGLISLLGLVLIMAGRIAPALTVAYLEARGQVAGRLKAEWSEMAAGITASAALGAWLIAPMTAATATLCAAAGCAQLARLARWQTWRVLTCPAILALHLAYGWAALGFGLLAIGTVRPELMGEAAAIHVWTIGAIGGASLAIMASMIRRQTRKPFASSTMLTIALAWGAAAAVTRLLAECGEAHRPLLLLLAAGCWIAAFAFFLIAFRDELLGRR
ncbi:NnrS family protein [Bosea sp. BIWAKO-01]|uniref:NnrS family protein n=1 Tax=Bosea sp. BIWAKO-01 TaxID=506668 RepID=UPI000852B50F|nr:NnrS family protein [Bosea sp. BIWAKO-01]GAU87061.1 NnrS protein [Bosea sp. BIWAKO-01]